MISLYFVRERFSNGGCGSGGTQPAIGQETAGHRSIAEQMNVRLAAEIDKAMFRPHIKQRILHLHRRQRHARFQQRLRAWSIEIGAADQLDLAGAALFVEP